MNHYFFVVNLTKTIRIITGKRSGTSSEKSWGFQIEGRWSAQYNRFWLVMLPRLAQSSCSLAPSAVAYATISHSPKCAS